MNAVFSTTKMSFRFVQCYHSTTITIISFEILLPLNTKRNSCLIVIPTHPKTGGNIFQEEKQRTCLKNISPATGFQKLQGINRAKDYLDIFTVFWITPAVQSMDIVYPSCILQFKP